MAGKRRTIYFYTGEETDNKGNVKEWGPAEWERFLKEYTKPWKSYFLGTNYYEGEVGESSTPVARYFHLLKPRSLHDWPEGKDARGNTKSLGVHRKALGLSEIDEYTYLLPVEGTNYVAMFRSSAGPTSVAAAEWMALYLKGKQKSRNFVFRPVPRKNAKEKLQSAVGVRSLYVQFEGQPHGKSESQIEKGVAVAASGKGLAGSDNMKINLNITLDRTQKEGLAVDGLLKETGILAKGANGGLPGAHVSRLKAKTLQPGKDGKIKVEQVDFFKERMTVRTEFGDADEAMDPNQIIAGMYDAIRKFRKKSGH